MVSIDRVYQKVLAFANKEQRGYITPQEFNLFADQAQMEIFEQYFYDLNQFLRLPGNSTGYSDMVNNLEEKISIFEKYNQEAKVVGDFGDVGLQFFSKVYRLQTVTVRYNSQELVTAEAIQLNELSKYSQSPLAKWSKKRPVYTARGGDFVADTGSRNLLKIYPYPSSDRSIDKVYISYIQTPNVPNWAYQVVDKKALYSEGETINFELHLSEESELVYRILAYAGISMDKLNLTQTAAALEQSKVQQEKQ